MLIYQNLKAPVLAKQYISIIRLLDYTGVDLAEEINQSRVRKQLNAEFGISQTGFIEVHGYSYTRQDVFEELDRPDFADRIKYHLKIWKSPELLSLLEKNKADFGRMREELKLLAGDDAFDVFFSPYFAGPFSQVSRTSLMARDFSALAMLLSFEDFLQPGDREEAFRPLRIFLDENQRLLRNVNKENYHIMRPQIELWVTETWHPLFNALPDEFYDTKAEMAALFINTTVALQKKNKKDCLFISTQLYNINGLPKELEDLISSNHRVFSDSGSSGRSGWGGIGWVIWIVLILARIVGSDSCSSNDNKYKFDSFKIEQYKPPPVYITDSAGNLQQKIISPGGDNFDSILKEAIRKNKKININYTR